MGANPFYAHDIEELTASFKEYADNDGFINARDFAQVLKHYGEVLTEDDLKELFIVADHDNKIEIESFVQMMFTSWQCEKNAIVITYIL